MRFVLVGAILALGVLRSGGVAVAEDLPLPVGQWSLDSNANDLSGRNHHAIVVDATYASRGDGQALRFDGQAGFMKIAAAGDLNISRAGAIAMWCRPDAPQGALFSWGEPSKPNNPNFAVVFDTRKDWGDPGCELRLRASGSRQYETYSTELPDLPVGQWTHVVICVKSTLVTFYFDAQPVMEVSLPFVMDLDDQPLVIGSYNWSGDDVFNGLIDDVAIYDRSLSPALVRDLYQQQCVAFGHDGTLLSRPSVEVHVQTQAGRITMHVRTARMGTMPTGATIRATLRDASASIPVDPTTRPMLLSLDTADLAPGDYPAEIAAYDGDGIAIGTPTRITVHWPGRDAAFRNVRVLNNLVWELLNVHPGELTSARQYTFTQPKQRWIYVRSEGRDFELTVDGKSALQPKAMLFLATGKHTLTVVPHGQGHVESLIIRSIPRLVFDSMVPEPHVESPIPLDQSLIRRYVAPNANVFTVIQSRRHPNTEQPLFHELISSGRRFLGDCNVLRKRDGRLVTVDEAIAYIADSWAMSQPQLNGFMADEFGMSEPLCTVYAQVIRKLHDDPRFAGREYCPYLGRMYTGDAGRQFIQALIDTKSTFAFKRYVQCPGTQQAARDYAWRSLVTEARHFQTLCPGSIERMVVCFGYFSTPNEFLNVVPQANYKTFLDMQFHMVAVEPEFWAAGGLMNYYVHYSDEETTRWIAHLYRHYGIEGSARLAATDPFDSSYLLANGDFAEGTQHWQIKPAVPDSIRVVDQVHFGWLEGRYPYTPSGDSALRMVRHADKPNVVTQTISHLQPGQLYTARMISAVQPDMSDKQPHVLRMDVRGAQVLPEQSFTQMYPNNYSHEYDGYDRDHPAWMTYHWLLFQAQSETAELSITDWANDSVPGGPIGQALIFNFVQVQPYFESGD